MTTTAEGGRFLRMIPADDAAALVAQVEDAAAALPQLRPGVRILFAGMLYRVDLERYYVSFGLVQGQPVIAGGGMQPERKRKAGRKA